MSRKPFFLLGLMLVGSVFATALPALADSVAAATSTADTNQSWLAKNGKASYLVWMTGMHTEALNGNRDGTGQNLEFDHYLGLGAALPGGFSIKLTNWAAQVIDEDPNSRQFSPGDPYFTLSHGKILHSDRYAANLEGYIRYYVPISRGTSDGLNKGTTRDYGMGMTRLYLNPTKSWLDGKLTFNGAVIWNVRWNKLSPDERLRRSTAQAALDGSTTPASYREDMYVVLDPSIVYSVSSKVDMYVEWASGYLRHTTSGTVTDAGGNHPVAAKWSSINNPSDGMYLSPGVSWNPTKKLNVNPYLSYQLSAVHDTAVASVKRRVGLFNADVGLQLQYTFN
ncbi:MAG: hypothetical protein ACXVCI_08695 [Bdellovibrionota bacterium]